MKFCYTDTDTEIALYGIHILRYNNIRNLNTERGYILGSLTKFKLVPHSILCFFKDLHKVNKCSTIVMWRWNLVRCSLSKHAIINIKRTRNQINTCRVCTMYLTLSWLRDVFHLIPFCLENLILNFVYAIPCTLIVWHPGAADNNFLIHSFTFFCCEYTTNQSPSIYVNFLV